MTDPDRIIVCPRCGAEIAEYDFPEGAGQAHIKTAAQIEKANGIGVPYCDKELACWVLRDLKKDGGR